MIYLKYFNEVLVVNSYADEKESNDKFYQLLNIINSSEIRKDIKINIPFQYEVYSNYGGIYILLYEKEIPFLVIKLIKFKDGCKIDELRSLRKKTGIGIILYTELSNTFGCLYSDTYQYLSTKNIWLKIIKTYPNRVFAYNRKTENLSKILEINGEYITEIGEKIFNDKNKPEDIILKLIK
jgi:hypothetical protein